MPAAPVCGLLLLPAHALHAGEELHVFHDGQVGRQGELLSDVAHPFADLIRVAHGIEAQDAALAGRPPEQARITRVVVDLPAPSGPISHKSRRGHLQRQPIDRRHDLFAGLELLGEPAGQNCWFGHGRFAPSARSIEPHLETPGGDGDHHQRVNGQDQGVAPVETQADALV